MTQRLTELLGERAEVRGSVGGGCINEAAHGVTASGRRFFVKTHRAPPANMFVAEAAGLEALRRGGCRVPEVLAVADDALVLEYIQAGPAGDGFAEKLGRGLALQHRVTRDCYGFEMDNYCGATPQPNPDMANGIGFFREARLMFQLRLLREKGRCSAGLERAVEGACARLEDWVVVEPPALLHGDLWGGNAMASADGEAVIYDPAAHFGFREADLAMTQLFGGFGPRFFAAYDEVYPIAAGYEDRRDLYNLYHVLNHSNLFGGAYARQAEMIARRYSF